MGLVSVCLGSHCYSLFLSLVPKGNKASLASVSLYVSVFLFYSLNFWTVDNFQPTLEYFTQLQISSWVNERDSSSAFIEDKLLLIPPPPQIHKELMAKGIRLHQFCCSNYHLFSILKLCSRNEILLISTSAVDAAGGYFQVANKSISQSVLEEYYRAVLWATIWHFSLVLGQHLVFLILSGGISDKNAEQHFFWEQLYKSDRISPHTA